MKSYKSAFPILFASLVTVMLGFGIVLPLLPYYITHFGASGSAMGVMMSIYSIMQFIFAPMWGRLSDRIGRKPVLLIGISGYAISFVLMAFSQNIFMLIITRALAGILSSATLPTAMAYAADITEAKDRSRGVGLMGAAMGTGMIFGPMLGGILSGVRLNLPGLNTFMQVMTDPSTGKVINLTLPFLFSALLALLAMPFIFFLLPESLAKEHRSTQAKPQGNRLSQLGSALKGPLGFFLAMAFLLAFALSNLEGVLGLYGKEHFNIGPTQLGLLMGAMGILSVIQQGFLIGPLTKRFGEVRVLQFGLLVSMSGLFGLALIPTQWALIAFSLIFSTGNVLLQPSVTSLVSQRASRDEQGQVMGYNNSFQSLGRAVGPLWAGFAYDIYPTLSFWTGAVIQLAAFAFAVKILGAFWQSAPAKTTPESNS